MAIVQAPTVNPGQVGVIGAIKYMTTTDSLGTITTAGYLNNIDLAVNPVLPSDILGVTYGYSYSSNSGTFGLFSVSISNGVITLSEQPSSGVVLPTIANHIATYTNITGTLSEDPATAISGGNIQAGLSGTAGEFTSYPATASNGTFSFQAVNNSNNFASTLNNSAVAQATTYSLPDPGAATANVILSTSGSAQTIAGGLTISTGNLGVTTGNVTAGSSGHAGTVSSYPATGSKGSLILAGVANTGNTNTTISNDAMGQASVVNIPDPGNSIGQFMVGATATPFVSGNFPQNSGTAGLMVDSGVSVASLSGAVTQLGQLQQISVTLNTAAIVAAYTTPQVLIPAVAGKVAIVHSANVYTASTGNTAFATGVAPIIQYGTTVHGAGTIATGSGLLTGDIEAASSQIRTLGPAASTTYTGITNTAVTFSCTTAYTAGTGTSITFTLVYELITATV